MPARPRTTSGTRANGVPSRLLPMSIAGVICLLLGGALGYTAWYLVGTQPQRATEDNIPLEQTPVASTTPLASPEPTREENASPPPTPKTLAPAGELPVEGGEVMLGGEGTDIPLRREIVDPFAIAETEVTNEQYQEFVKATGHKPPANWNGQDFPSGAALEPVTGVTWRDAVDYCKWLSEKIGATVELPTEAQWELAARGKEGFTYPWGNEWNDRAATSEGRIRPVRSYPEGKSPSGAYDMAGNVWEWVADQATDKTGKPATENGVPLRIIKGGSAEEEREYISARVRYARPADRPRHTIGFRYIVRRDIQNATPKPSP